ncbi:MAG: TonB-dependent receptor [Roseiarcus sp.]|jgi:outer membrane receptor protein involved in Fe transport
MSRAVLLASAALLLFVPASVAQTAPPLAGQGTGELLPTIEVLAITPLSGAGIDIDKAPSAVTVIDQAQVERAGSPSVVKALTQQVPSVSVSDVSGNAFQPDVMFRGFDASPVSGTPQGLAVYQNGVRINEAFGDVVNWDLIPTIAIRSMDLISNNPAFGFNALGGALSLQMKDGFTNPGGTLDVSGGSYGRAQTALEWGKQVGQYAVYGALEGVQDNGYRDFSASQVRRFYGDVGYKGDSSEFHVNVGLADNHFGATASAPIQLLQQSWSSVYTTPQTSADQLAMVNLTGRVDVSPTWSLQGDLHVRAFDQHTVDGNSTNVQPCSDPTLLCFNNATDPANGLNGKQLNNTFPSSAVLGEIDRTKTQSTTYGAALQATNTDKILGHDNQFVIGGSVDYSITNYSASAELGTVAPNYVVVGSGIFLGPSGNPVSDGPVRLRATNVYSGLYGLDAFDVTDKLTVTGGARLNVADINLDDQLGGGASGDSQFIHLNPMIGATYRLTPEITAYGSYSQANRAPTPLELGCANPVQPCILASFVVSDPPLKQVIARTFEAGLRGTHDFGGTGGTLGWSLGAFRTQDSDDLLNVPSPQQQGFGYVTNIGNTLREGVEAQLNYKNGPFSAYASYAYVNAIFLTSLQLASNSPAANAAGLIQVSPGDQMSMIPRNRVKLGADYAITPKWNVGGDVLYTGAQRFLGDQSNQEPMLPAYGVVSLNSSYKITENFQIYARIENLLDSRYYAFGTYFDTASLFGNLTDPQSVSPGQPRSFYAGMKATF